MMAFIMIFSFMPAPMHAQGISESNQDKAVFEEDNFQTECRIDNKWQERNQIAECV